MKYQLKLGKKVEREHLGTYKMLMRSKKMNKCPSKDQFYESIAKDHLKEFPNKPYYSELGKMEKKLR